MAPPLKYLRGILVAPRESWKINEQIKNKKQPSYYEDKEALNVISCKTGGAKTASIK